MYQNHQPSNTCICQPIVTLFYVIMMGEAPWKLCQTFHHFPSPSVSFREGRLTNKFLAEAWKLQQARLGNKERVCFFGGGESRDGLMGGCYGRWAQSRLGTLQTNTI